jgi:NADPH:quinone reductase-like Zn-dependent oxidoreductase
MASTMKFNGVIASIGLAAGFGLNTTVMPFILRGVSLLGIDSVNAPMPLREKVWKRLGSDLKPRQLKSIVTTVNFAELPGVFAKILDKKMRGRTVVKIG